MPALKIIAVLDICATTGEHLRLIRAPMLESIKHSVDPELVAMAAQWFIERVDSCLEEKSSWWIETMLRSLAATGTDLDDGSMETQCLTLKQSKHTRASFRYTY